MESGETSGTLGAFRFIRRVAFPTTVEVLSIFFGVAFLSTLVALPSTRLQLTQIFRLTLLLIIAPTILGELANRFVILRGDPVLDFRRLMGLEVIAWGALVFLIPLSSVLSVWINSPALWTGAFFVGLAVSLPIRSLSIFAMSRVDPWRKALATTLLPLLVVLSYSNLPVTVGIVSARPLSAILTATSLSHVSSIVAVSRFVRGVERTGSPTIGDSPMGLFRDFLLHWLKKERIPLEARLSRLGHKQEVELSTLAFFSRDGAPNSCVIVSNIHPGPYRDLGSGGLPSALKSRLEASVGGTALVPHGISSHELNIILQDDVRKILEEAREHYPSNRYSALASRFVREESDDAKASAQAFGNVVLLMLTLAPQDMEDIPAEVLTRIETAAREKGFSVVPVDAHNSLSTQTAITQDQSRRLTEAALKALKTISEMSQSPYRVGAASHQMNEFSIEDGMGPGGLSVLVIEAEGQTASYLTFDGNNMQSGLRDVILDMLRAEGVDEAEITTTDTHLVTGLVNSSLGYHPVGEGIDKDVLVQGIRETLRKAFSNLQEGSSGFSHFNLNLTVLGSGAFNSITSFINRMATKIGRFLFEVEIATTLLTILILSLW